MKTQIEKHKIGGKVHIWTYKDNQRNYPGWNITTDLKASEQLTQLLNLMNLCDWSSKKTFRTESPTNNQLSTLNNQRGFTTWKSKPNLTLNCKTTEPEDHWLIRETDFGIEIQFGKTKLTELKNSINRIREGEGDFAISDQNDENILYFWHNIEE
jgi:hypothetical protein